MPYLNYSQIRLPRAVHNMDDVSAILIERGLTPLGQDTQAADIASKVSRMQAIDPIPLTILSLLISSLMGIGLYMWVRSHRKHKENAAAEERARQKKDEDFKYPPEDRINHRDFSIQQKNASNLPPIVEEAKHNEKAPHQNQIHPPQGSVRNDRLQHYEPEPEHGDSRQLSPKEDIKPVQRDAQQGPSRPPTIREETKSESQDPPKHASHESVTKDGPHSGEPGSQPTASKSPLVQPVPQDPENLDLPPPHARKASVQNLLRQHTL